MPALALTTSEDVHAGTPNGPKREPYEVALEEVPVTVERPPYRPKDGDALIHPGTVRANIAASNEAPEGSKHDLRWADRYRHLTVVQQHCAYFDPDADNVIWPGDTYRGCRNFGWNRLLAAFAAFIIHVNLSYATLPSLFPDPLFRIYIDRMHKNKHGSDSLTYDSEGRFCPQKFEEIWTKYDRGNKGGLNIGDLLRFHKGQRIACDPFGWSATFLEWLAVYLLLWPADGVLQKEDVRRVFDGTMFYHKADEHAARQRGVGDKKGIKAY